MNKYFLNFDANIYNNIFSLNNNNKTNSTSINNKIFKNLKRNTVIIPYFIDKKFSINIGNSYKVIKISKDMVGSKVGIYIKTRNFVDHSKKKNKKK